MQKERDSVPEGYTVIYRPYITLKNGKRLYATHYGKKSWRIVVPVVNGKS